MSEEVCSYCGSPTPEMILNMHFGRCRKCFMRVGLNDGPPPPDVASDTAKIPCNRCGTLILPATSWKTHGYCMSCVDHKDAPLPTDPIVAKARFSRAIETEVDTPPSRFAERYENGEREAVWREMRELGGAIGKGSLWDDVRRTVSHTMQRARFNIETIVGRLRVLGYQFSRPDAVHISPTDESLTVLDELEQEFGSFPLSLRVFYEVVGSVNLCQSIDQLEMGVFEKEARSRIPILHLMGEEYPLYVASPETLLRHATRASQISDGRRYLWIAPDECGRAHYSNGDDCHVLLPDPGVDFRWVEMRDESISPDEWLWFVDVLRQVFKGGGFQGRSDPDNGWKRQPPDNEVTRILVDGLLPI